MVNCHNTFVTWNSKIVFTTNITCRGSLRPQNFLNMCYDYKSDVSLFKPTTAKGTEKMVAARKSTEASNTSVLYKRQHFRENACSIIEH